MKKFVALLLTVMMLLGSYVPAMAQPAVPSQPGLTVTASDSAAPGDTVQVTLTAEPAGNAKMVNWDITFPKQTVAMVQVMDNGVPCRDTGLNWTCNWTTPLKSNKSLTLSFNVTLTGSGGFGLPLVAVNYGSMLIGQKLIDVIQPDLIWMVVVPTPMIYGGRPFSIYINVTNTTNFERSFDVSAQVFHVATDSSVTPEIYGGEIYNTIGDSLSLTMFWHGVIPAGESMTLNLGTASGSGLGTFNLFVLTDLVAAKELKRSTITLVQGTVAPYGELEIMSMTGMPVMAGDYVAYTPTFYSNVLGQFVTEAVQSTCPFEGLPTGSTSNANLTYVKYLYYVRILPMTKPAGATDPYTVNCNLKVNFYFQGYPGTKYVATYDFPVIVP